MKNQTQLHDNGLILTGLDGSNPLAFLAALGTLHTLGFASPDSRVKMNWVQHAGAWRPVLAGCLAPDTGFCQVLAGTLEALSTKPFEFDKKLPFPASTFREHALNTQREASSGNRRVADFLAAFGCDALVDNKGDFLDTKLRMVRSGDAAGQGLPAYAGKICSDTNAEDLHRALFENWTYTDTRCSLRLDPSEDRQYALRAADPSKEATLSVRGANRLAIEAMPLMCTVPVGNVTATVGFRAFDRHRILWTWPIWRHALSQDSVRSIISLSQLQQEVLDVRSLEAMGIAAVYRCSRVATSKYYHNLSPSSAVM